MGRKNKRGALKPDLTPLIDVIFLLIIFFMISTTFNNYGTIPIELPSSTVESKKENKAVEIIVDKHGRFYVSIEGKNQEVTLEEIPNHLQGVEEVTISADRDMKYQTVMNVMTKVKEQNIANMGLTFYE
ncbi:biopolymer transporter ExbD [Fusobacterium necrophorum]|uniref:Biopolymer transporter ExbD n=1 Tax=Fusobacterium necrophorum TaxID=859 RepID=A0A4V1QY17_9FUSO|nr:biopolymer transporter ExbD [Fusobacterium necrophorum]RXZ71596.1 biopolymer transporter ExbD [Fusobacterium necrophorum]